MNVTADDGGEVTSATRAERLAATASPLAAGVKAKVDSGVTWLKNRPVDEQQRAAWAFALWDWAVRPFSTAIVAFGFVPLYLMSAGFLDPRVAVLPVADPVPQRALTDLAAGIGGWVSLAGLVMAVLAPVLATISGGSGRLKRRLGWANFLLIFAIAALFLVRPESRFFPLGGGLLALALVIDDVAKTNYHILTTYNSPPPDQSSGWLPMLRERLGFVGGILALLVLIALERAGHLALDPASGMGFRWLALGVAIWALVFSWPLYRYIPEPPVDPGATRLSWKQSYSLFFQEIQYLFYSSRSTFWFLIVSALYRSGFAAIFFFGALMAVTIFGFTAFQVLLFGVAAYLIAALSSLVFAKATDYWGARRTITNSLVVLLLSAAAAFALHLLGAVLFWIFGLLICAALGAALSASRTYLLQVAPDSHREEVLSLYQTCGRATTFIATGLWTLLVVAFGATVYGWIAIILVIALGLAGLIFLVKTPPRNATNTAGRMTGARLVD